MAWGRDGKDRDTPGKEGPGSAQPRLLGEYPIQMCAASCAMAVQRKGWSREQGGKGGRCQQGGGLAWHSHSWCQRMLMLPSGAELEGHEVLAAEP